MSVDSIGDASAMDYGVHGRNSPGIPRGPERSRYTAKAEKARFLKLTTCNWSTAPLCILTSMKLRFRLRKKNYNFRSAVVW